MEYTSAVGVRMPSQNSSGAIYSSSCGVNSPTVCWSVPPRYALSPRTEMLSGRMPPWKWSRPTL